MTKLTEHQIVPIACVAGAPFEHAAAEIVSRDGDVQSDVRHESTVASELASLTIMPYSELHLAWRRHYRALPPKRSAATFWNWDLPGISRRTCSVA